MNSEAEDAPKISLGGKQWPVPILAARQNKIIDPLILSLLPIFSVWHKDKTVALSKIGTEQYDAFLEIALQAIRRASPDITREQFMDLSITLPELIAAFPVIAQQTGVFQRGEPGEAQAAVSRPTGNE